MPSRHSWYPPLVRRLLAVIAAVAVVAFAGRHSARADIVAVDVELVLAVDVSLSMDPDEQRLQRDGYVEAIKDPDVVAAIRANALGKIGITYVEWAGNGTQKVTMPWALIDGLEAAQAFSDKLASAPIMRAQRTSISGALAFAGRMFEQSGFRGNRRVIDVSGDGPNNDGPLLVPVRDGLIARGITINGLPILLKAANGWFDLENLDEYYEDCVIGGFAAFMIVVRERSEFARAVKRKLLLEIADAKPDSEGRPRVIRIQAGAEPPAQPRLDARPQARPGPRSADRAKVDCEIGEKRLQQYLGGRRGTF